MYSLFEPLIKIYKLLYLFAYDMTGNYGVALVLLSLFTFVVLYPFNKKAQQLQNKEHKIQAVLAPQVAVIKKQYNGREQYEQLQWLYQRYGYHPLYAIRSALGFIFQIPFLTAAYYMLSRLAEIQGVAWGVISDLGAPDHLLAGINLLPFVMTLVTCVYAFVMPEISKKERLQTIAIGFFFLLLLYTAPSALLIFWTCNLLWSLLDSVLSRQIEWMGEFISENELAFHIILALSLTIGLLVPTDIYIKNASQLWFEYKDILKFFLKDTVFYFVAFVLVYLLCWGKKIRNRYLSILLGLLFCVFLQSYIISIDYGLFDGHEIEWEKYTKVGLLNTFIWVFCLVETFIKFTRSQHRSEKMIKFVKQIAFGIVVIQCFVLLVNLKNKPIQKDILFEEGKAGVLTTKDLYTVSEKENIIIFLLDGFDSSAFEEVLQKNPDFSIAFKDFTYYPDTTSSFGFTHFSLPEILTGKLCVPTDKYSDYLHEAWKDNYYYRKLKEKDYAINIYTSGNYIDKNAPVNNLVAEKIIFKAEAANIFADVTKFRMSPHYLKRIFYQYQPSIFNPSLINGNIKTYEENDRDFFLGLKKGLTKSKSNMFKFYHLAGMHDPYILNENVEYLKDGEKGTAFKQGIGTLKIVREYLMQLKQEGLYENTMFVVMADHGFHNSIGTRPLFLMKPPQKDNAKLTVSQRPSMVSELMPMVFHDLGFTVTKDMPLEQQRIYHLERDGKFIRYLVKSPASELNSWIELGGMKKQLFADRQYHIGSVIDFTEHGNSNNYKTFGWSDLVWTGSIITDHIAEIIVVIDSEKPLSSDFTLEIECHPLLEFFGVDKKVDFRDMKLYANDVLIGEWRLKDKNTVELDCRIPQSVFNQKKIAFHFEVDNPSGSTQPVRLLIRSFKISEN